MYNFKKRIIYVIALSQQDDCDLIKLNFKGKFNQTNQWQDLFSVTDFFYVQKKKIWSITRNLPKLQITDYIFIVHKLLHCRTSSLLLDGACGRVALQ